MNDSEDLHFAIADPIWHKIRATGDHQLSGAGHAAGSPQIRKAAEAGHRGFYALHEVFGGSNAVFGHKIANLFQVPKCASLPADPHARV
jgi:hypothetical protein